MKCGGCCAGLWVCGLGCFGSFQVERLGLELERVQFAAKAEAARLQSGFRAQGFDCTSSNSFHQKCSLGTRPGQAGRAVAAYLSC